MATGSDTTPTKEIKISDTDVQKYGTEGAIFEAQRKEQRNIREREAKESEEAKVAKKQEKILRKRDAKKRLKEIKRRWKRECEKSSDDADHEIGKNDELTAAEVGEGGGGAEDEMKVKQEGEDIGTEAMIES